jgi:hypothetical protein
LKIKEYLLATSSFTSAGDLDILFKDEPWGRPGAHTWASARDYFTAYREDLIGLTMTMDSPNTFWRAYITQGLENCIYEEISAIGRPSLGLLSIRVHLEEESDSKHREALGKMNFLEDDHGYWSHNIWSE